MANMAASADPNPFDSGEDQTLQLEAVEPQSFNHLELTLPASPSLQAQTNASQQQQQQHQTRKHPHHAHHHPHVTAAMYISSHGAAAVQGLDLDDCDDDNPFDSPRLPAHSRPHLLDVTPVDSCSDAICAGDEPEVVPHWRKEYRTLLALAIPSVLVNLTSVMITIISQALVGRLSVESLAAAVCSTMYFNLLWMGVYGFAGALDTLAAQSFGAGSMEGVNLWTKRALLLVSILTVPVMILLALGYPFLKYVLGQSEEISVDGALYCQWMILGIWPQNMTVVLQKYLQAQEILRPIIWQGVAANIFNVLVEIFLIWPAGMGLQGSALGMSLARWFQFGLTVHFILRRNQRLEREELDRVAAEVDVAQYQPALTGADAAAAVAADQGAEGAATGEGEGDTIYRSPSEAAIQLLRSSSIRLASGVRDGVSGVRDGVADSAALVKRGVIGAVAYAQDPRALVADVQAQRAVLMEGVWNRAAIKQFVVLGISAGATTAIEAYAFDGIGIIAATLTVIELDAHYVMLNTALTTYFTLPLGISIAASIRVGHLIGSGQVRTAQLCSKLVGLSGLGFMAVSGFTIAAARNSIGYIFSHSAEVVAQVARIAPICGLFQLFDGIQGSTGGVLRGLGLQKWAALINCVGLWLCGVPVGYLLCFPGGVGLPGLWWGLAVGLLIVAVGNCLLLWRVDWHKQVARARERIAIDAAEHAARRAEIAAAAAEGNIVGDYSDEVALQRQRENDAGQGQDHSLTQL